MKKYTPFFLKRFFTDLRSRPLTQENDFTQRLWNQLASELPKPISRWQTVQWWMSGHRRALASTAFVAVFGYGALYTIGYPPLQMIIPGIGKPALAAAVDNTFSVADATEFRYQRIHFVRNILPGQDEGAQSIDETIEIWQSGANMRKDVHNQKENGMSVFDFESIAQEQDTRTTCQISVEHRDGTQIVSAGNSGMCQLISLKEKGENFILDTEQKYSVEFDDKKDGHHYFFTWNTAQPIKGEAQLLYGIGGPAEIGGWLTTERYDEYGNLEQIRPEEECEKEEFLNCPSDEEYTHRLGFITQQKSSFLIQLSLPDGVSPIYEFDIDKKTLQPITATELQEKKQFYEQRRVYDQIHTNQLQQWYRHSFRNAINIRQKIHRLGLPEEKNSLEKNGHTIETTTYRLPVVFAWEVISEEYVAGPAHTITFVVDVDANLLLEYTIAAKDGSVIEQATLEEQKIIDEDPNDFFTVDHWKKEIAPYLE